MKLLGSYIKKLTARAVKNGVRVNVLGERSRLSPELLRVIEKYTAKTAAGKLQLNILIDYGGRGEIVRAANAALESGQTLTEESLSAHLYTAEMPPLDLIVRTGGEIRLSNFMLWQAAYAELYFTDVLWPDFGEKELDIALENFAKRERRYGKIEC